MIYDLRDVKAIRAWKKIKNEMKKGENHGR